MNELIFSIPIASLLSFIALSILSEITPGPNMTYLAMVGAKEGRYYGFMTVIGVALGLTIIGVAAALGVTQIIQTSNFLYETLRWAGVLFLFYLAWEAWVGEKPSTQGALDKKGSKYFYRGLITNLLNPKAAAFFVTVLPNFLPQNANLSHSLFLTAIFVLIATIIHALIVAAASTLAPYLADPKREQTIRRILALLLCGVAIWIAFETAR